MASALVPARPSWASWAASTPRTVNQPRALLLLAQENGLEI